MHYAKHMHLVFLHRVSRQFDGHTIYREPLGGTQSALVYLARELARLGHRVSVFCHTGTAPQFIDKVYYAPLKGITQYAKESVIDFLVCVADEQALKLGIPATHTVWWPHNDYCFLWGQRPDIRTKLSKLVCTKADKIIALSQWHKEVLQHTFQFKSDHAQVIPNGVHWPYFEKLKPQDSTHRLIYSSVPDRGLDVLLKIFPRIREQVPQSELYIYSSFQVWGKSSLWDHSQAGTLYEQAKCLQGVHLEAPLRHSELAKALSLGAVWVYPLHASYETQGWAETSCIAALEAQAAGLPVVSSYRGALPESVQDQVTARLIHGDAYSRAYQEQFVEATVHLLKTPQQRLAWSKAAQKRIQADFCWPTIAHQWESLLRNFESSKERQAGFVSSALPPRLSLVVWVESSETLRDFMENCRAQSFTQFEVIVCSSKAFNSHEELMPYQKQLNLVYRVPFFKKRNQAWAHALTQARGQAVFFVSSRHRLHRESLNFYMQAYEAAPQGLVVAPTEDIHVPHYVYRDTTIEVSLEPSEHLPDSLEGVMLPLQKALDYVKTTEETLCFKERIQRESQNVLCLNLPLQKTTL